MLVEPLDEGPQPPVQFAFPERPRHQVDGAAGDGLPVAEQFGVRAGGLPDDEVGERSRRWMAPGGVKR